MTHEVCVCGLQLNDQIWMCPHHVYYKGRQKFESVSCVVKAIFPTDYSGIDPEVLSNAAKRGTFIDTYFSEWLQGAPMMSPLEFREMILPRFERDKYKTPAEHAEDCRVRLERLLDWWTGLGWKIAAVQKIVYSATDGIAGTLDLRTAGSIYDLKCVSELQPAYRLQLGAYAEYDGDHLEQCGIIHVAKDRIILKHYPLEKCREQWRNGVAWYRTTKELAS